MILVLVLLISFQLGSTLITQADEDQCFNTNGRNFVMTFFPMDSTPTANHSVILQIIATNSRSTSLRLQTPVRTSGNFDIPVEVPARATAEIELTSVSEAAENTKSTISVLVTSTEDVAVSAFQIEAMYSGGYIVYPTMFLGADYVALTYNTGKSLLNIIATSAGVTDISVTLPTFLSNKIVYQSVSYGAGDSFTITLNQYENYLLSADEDLTTTNLHGSKVFSLFCANKHVEGASDKFFDGEQITPVHLWGTRYVITPSHSTESDTYRVIVKRDTSVTVGRQSPVLVHKNSYLQFISFNEPEEIIADGPVLVARFRKDDNGDLSFIILSPIQNYARYFIFKTPTNIGTCEYDWNMTFVYPQTGSGVTLTSGIADAPWQDIPNTEYRLLSTKPEGSSKIHEATSTDMKFSVVTHAASEACSSLIAIPAVAISPAKSWDRTGEIYITQYSIYTEDRLPHVDPLFGVIPVRSSSECYRYCTELSLCSYVAVESRNGISKHCHLYNSYFPCLDLTNATGVKVYKRMHVS